MHKAHYIFTFRIISTAGSLYVLGLSHFATDVSKGIRSQNYTLKSSQNHGSGSALIIVTYARTKFYKSNVKRVYNVLLFIWLFYVV